MAAYKARNPEELVFLLVQGWGFSDKPTRYDPINRSDFFAGHWLYFEGSTLTGDIPAESGQKEIPVEDVSLFQTFDRQFTTPDRADFTVADDVGLCDLNEDGTPNWHRSEQVRFRAIDRDKGTITVERGMHGTEPRAFKAGQGDAPSCRGRSESCVCLC